MHSNMKKFILLACFFSWGLLSCNKDEDEKNYCSKVAKPINRFGHAGQYTYTCGHCGNNVSEPAKKCVQLTIIGSNKYEGSTNKINRMNSLFLIFYLQHPK